MPQFHPKRECLLADSKRTPVQQAPRHRPIHIAQRRFAASCLRCVCIAFPRNPHGNTHHLSTPRHNSRTVHCPVTVGQGSKTARSHPHWHAQPTVQRVKDARCTTSSWHSYKFYVIAETRLRRPTLPLRRGAKVVRRITRRRHGHSSWQGCRDSQLAPQP